MALICNAILYHFQITFLCGHINRHIIPLTLFLLSYPLEQLEFIRFSNFTAENSFVPVTRPQPFILPRKFQSRYRRHLAQSKLPFQLLLARGSFNQLSRLFIHSVQEFKIRSIQSRKDVRETHIVALRDHVPQRISLTNHHPPDFLLARHRGLVFCARLSSLFLGENCDVFSLQLGKYSSLKIKNAQILYTHTFTIPPSTKR